MSEPERPYLIGQEVELEAVLAGRPFMVSTSLLELRPESLVLELPHVAALAGVRPNAAVRIKFYDSVGLRMADTTLIVAGHPPGTAVLRVPRNVQVLRRRAWFRVSMAIPVKYAVMRSARAKVSATTVHDALTQDVSGGGVRFETPLPLDAGDGVEVRLTPPGQAPLLLHCRVARTFPGSAGTVSVGLEYVGIDESDRNRIVAMLVEAQRKQRASARRVPG